MMEFVAGFAVGFVAAIALVAFLVWYCIRAANKGGHVG